MPRRRVSAFESNDLDERILRELFQVLKAPPVDLIRAALERREARYRAGNIGSGPSESDFAHEELFAEERAKLAEVDFRGLSELRWQSSKTS